MSTIDVNSFLNLKTEDDVLQYCNSVRNLGPTISDRLSWTRYLTETNKVVAGVYSLGK